MARRVKTEESVESPIRPGSGRLRRATTEEYEEYYRSGTYLQDYTARMDARVEMDPQKAIGGAWEEVGIAQLDFLVGQGLRPYHTLLDIGCGTLRAGRHFINYLDAGKYTGMDISPKAIEFARQLVQEERLTQKAPNLTVNTNGDLKLEQFEGQVFHFILAHAVFIHLGIDFVEECLANIGRLMANDSAFFFTFSESEELQRTGFRLARYPFAVICSLSDKYGFELTDLSDEYVHPKRPGGQRMVKLMRAHV